MSETWRDDPGMVRSVVYKKRFAFLPTTCLCGTKVWLKYYYRRYELWSHGSNKIYDDGDAHTDYIGNITEEEYMVRKLAETL